MKARFDGTGLGMLVQGFSKSCRNIINHYPADANIPNVVCLLIFTVRANWAYHLPMNCMSHFNDLNDISLGTLSLYPINFQRDGSLIYKRRNMMRISHAGKGIDVLMSRTTLSTGFNCTLEPYLPLEYRSLNYKTFKEKRQTYHRHRHYKTQLQETRK